MCGGYWYIEAFSMNYKIRFQRPFIALTWNNWTIKCTPSELYSLHVYPLLGSLR